MVYTKMSSRYSLTMHLAVVFNCMYRQQVTVIEIFLPPIPDAPPPSATATPSSMCSPANGMSPLTSSDPSPSLGGHMSVIVDANTTPVVNKVTLLSNK